AEGSADRALSTPLRAADLSEKPLPRSCAHEARRVPRAGDRAPDRSDARAGDLGEARPVAGALRPPVRDPSARWRLAAARLTNRDCEARRRLCFYEALLSEPE